MQGSDKVPNTPTQYDSSSFNTSILNDMNNMSMVSFNIDALDGLGEIGQSMIIDDVNIA